MEETTNVDVSVKETPVDSTTPGKRQRKQVEFFATVAATEKKKDHAITHSGLGIKLAQYDYFVQELTRVKGDSELVKSLHALMYNVPGRKANAKHNLREFNGFSSDVGVKDKTEKVMDNKKKWTVSLLKEALSLFGLERGGNRDELCHRLVEYLANPHIIKGNGLVKRRRSASKSPKKKSKKSKGEKKRRAPSAYILFCSAHRAEAKKENPELSMIELTKILGEKWGACAAEEKEKWQVKAAEEKAKLEAEGGDVVEQAEEGDEEEEEDEDDGDDDDKDEDDGAESDDLKASDDEDNGKEEVENA